MKEELIYLDTYVLQQDMRIRLPKSVLKNMKIEKGNTNFQIYYDKAKETLILKPEKIKSQKTKEEQP